MRKISLIGVLIIFAAGFSTILAQNDKVKYIPHYSDPTLKKMTEEREAAQEAQEALTDSIKDSQEELREEKRDARMVLSFDMSDIKKPDSPGVFTTPFHFPPVAQYMTGTCWSFSATSFIESETARLYGKKVKLSEMYTVYQEYLEKVREYVRERGDSRVSSGSEGNAVLRMIAMHGAVPLDVYPGYVNDERYDHRDLNRDLRALLGMIEEKNIWDEEYVVSLVKVILNKYMGKPPDKFEYEGASYTPEQFAEQYLQFKLNDYINVISTLKFPFYTQGELDVADNWWHDSSYYNIPLEEWYKYFKSAIDNGYTLELALDNSEPGYNGFEEIAIVPDFDIPGKYINQNSREFRIYNHTTGDDHGVHLIGHKKIGGHDWYLIKDSARAARWGEHKGFLYFRDDYIRLKILAYIVHKDVVKDMLTKFAQK